MASFFGESCILQPGGELVAWGLGRWPRAKSLCLALTSPACVLRSVTPSQNPSSLWAETRCYSQGGQIWWRQRGPWQVQGSVRVLQHVQGSESIMPAAVEDALPEDGSCRGLEGKTSHRKRRGWERMTFLSQKQGMWGWEEVEGERQAGGQRLAVSRVGRPWGCPGREQSILCRNRRESGRLQPRPGVRPGSSNPSKRACLLQAGRR